MIIDRHAGRFLFLKYSYTFVYVAMDTTEAQLVF